MIANKKQTKLLTIFFFIGTDIQQGSVQIKHKIPIHMGSCYTKVCVLRTLRAERDCRKAISSPRASAHLSNVVSLLIYRKVVRSGLFPVN